MIAVGAQRPRFVVAFSQAAGTVTSITPHRLDAGFLIYSKEGTVL